MLDPLSTRRRSRRTNGVDSRDIGGSFANWFRRNDVQTSLRYVRTVALRPHSCRRCGKELRGSDPEPIRHQVWELPEIEPIIVEYQRHRLTCDCGTTTCAVLPSGVPTGQFGARLLAFTGLLMGHFRQSKRRAASFLSDLLNRPCCPAATVKMQNRVCEALEQPDEDLKARLAGESQLFMDESPTKQANQKAWLWTAVAPTYAVFAIFASRAATALPKLLGDQFRGGSYGEPGRSVRAWKNGVKVGRVWLGVGDRL